MRRTVSFVLTTLVVLSAMSVAPSANAKGRDGSRVRQSSQSATQAQTGRVTVAYTSVSETALKAAKAKGGSLARGAKYGKHIVVTPPAGVSAEEFASELRGTPGVKYAEPEVKMTAAWVPNDPYFNNPGWQWGLSTDQGIDMANAWTRTRGNASVVIAVVDSGISFSHPDRPARIDSANDRDFVDGDYVAEDQNGHGTAVAGIIAAATNNGYGMAGIAPDCTILPVRALDAAGRGTDVIVADGIRWAADHGADIINLSVGGPAGTQAMADAVSYARGKGCVLVAASGNAASQYPGQLAYPAGLRGVISVGALGVKPRNTPPNYITLPRERHSYSQYGPPLDLMAPGTSVLSLDLSSNWLAPQTGTSFAAPHVSGVAALVRTLHPTWTPDEVELALERSALDLYSPGFDPYYGNGEVIASSALAVSSPPALPPSDDDIPGLPIGVTPVTGFIDRWDDYDDVFSVSAAPGETIELTLRGTSFGASGADWDLFLFGPGATSVNLDVTVAQSATIGTSTERLSYRVPQGAGGTYYVDVLAYAGNGSYTLHWDKGIKSKLALNAPSKVTLGTYITITGSLRDDTVAGLAGRPVVIEALPSGSRRWVAVGTGTTGSAGGYAVRVKPSRSTRYRARFHGSGTGYTSATSASRAVTAYAYLSRPSAPKTIKRGRKFTSVGYMKPRHAVGNHTVQLRMYRRESGKWKLRKTVRAKNVYNSTNATKYKTRYSLPSKGKWKIVAKVGRDSRHVTTRSSARYVRVY